MQAYESVDKSTMSGREIEAAVLTKARESLKNAGTTGKQVIAMKNWISPLNSISASGVFFRANL